MSLNLDGGGRKATEICQLAGFRAFEVTSADPSTPFPDTKTQQALWKHIAPHAVENLLIFVDAERTRSAWLWMKRDGSKDNPTRRAQIDALVARLYDLTIPEFQHILSTFPLVDESVKSQTLNTYRELLKLGNLPDPRQ